MIARDALADAELTLAACGIENPSLESEVLLRHVLSIDRVHLYVNMDRTLSPEERDEFTALVERRANREPIAYITGHKEFFGLSLEVDRSVLVPRPETELLVEKAIAWAMEKHDGHIVAVDVGTGSGAIAVALATHLPHAMILAVDTSTAALEVAARNIEHHGAVGRVKLLKGDALEPIPDAVHLIVANPPYIKTSEIPKLPPEIALFEPVTALDGGTDGLDIIRRLIIQARTRLLQGGALMIEIGFDQGDQASQIAGASFPDSRIKVIPDLGGRDRLLIVEAPDG